MEHRAKGENFETGNPPEGWDSEGEFRISKLGTRPEGGSPQDNCEIKESEFRIQNERSKSKYLLSTDYWLLATDY